MINNNTLKRTLSFLDKLPFSYKSTFLLFIIIGGMIIIISLSQISIYTLKNDFDILFEKRTKPIIQLENIKDTYKINIYDTFYEIQQKNINIKQAKEIVTLGQQLINKNWKIYKEVTLGERYEKSFVTKLLNNYFFDKKSFDNSILEKNIIPIIDKKISEIHSTINRIVKLLERSHSEEATGLINTIYFEINSVNIYLANLTNYDLNLAITEKDDTQRIYSLLIFILNLSIVFVFLLSILLSVIVINHFRKLHFNLEDAVSEKTKELQEINDYLEIKIKKEVTNSRKKDLIMFQQSKLASLGEMLGNIAHQWRQPLGSLMMIIQAFQTKMSLGKLSYEFVEQKVEDALLLSENMSNTLSDFQNFFSPNKDRIHFKVKDCVEHSIHLSKYLLERENIELKLITIDDIEIYSFYNELSHVLLNIISNSKDALQNKEEQQRIIKIVVKKHYDNIRINIYDNAGGIDEKIILNIFEPYYTTKYKSAGTGIGLYMSKQIIETHMNGLIKCKNVFNKLDGLNLEYGALFTIDIPLTKEKDE